MNTKKDEHVVLVDEADREIGLADKGSIHTESTPLHRGFSLFGFDDAGQLLLQRRALTKKTWPGIWSNTVCGHPQSGETYEAAAKRRLAFELGIKLAQTDIIMALADYRYRYEHTGVVENEICPVMIARIDRLVDPNPDEVAETRWIIWQDFLNEINQPNEYSEWCVEEAQLLSKSPVFRKFLQRSTISTAD
jgi:isopentenyl-diphosphate delta-isomerase